MKFENKGKWVKQITESSQKNDTEDLSKDMEKAVDDLEKFAKSKGLTINHKDKHVIDTGVDINSNNKINFLFTLMKAQKKLYAIISINSYIPELAELSRSLPLIGELDMTQSNITKVVNIIKQNYEKLDSAMKDIINEWKKLSKSSGSFNKALMQIFELADKHNLEKLCSIYPELGRKFAIWKSSGRTDKVEKL